MFFNCPLALDGRVALKYVVQEAVVIVRGGSSCLWFSFFALGIAKRILHGRGFARFRRFGRAEFSLPAEERIPPCIGLGDHRALAVHALGHEHAAQIGLAGNEIRRCGCRSP